MPKKWEASAVLLAEERNIIKPLMEGRAVPTTVADQKADRHAAGHEPPDPARAAQLGGWPTEHGRADEERLLNQLRGRIKIGSPRDELIRSPIRTASAGVPTGSANKLAEIYVRESDAAKERESREAFDFIAKRVKEYGDKLTESHQALLAYYNGPDRGTESARDHGRAPTARRDTPAPPAIPRRVLSPAELAALRAEEATLTVSSGGGPGAAPCPGVPPDRRPVPRARPPAGR